MTKPHSLSNGHRRGAKRSVWSQLKNGFCDDERNYKGTGGRGWKNCEGCRRLTQIDSMSAIQTSAKSAPFDFQIESSTIFRRQAVCVQETSRDN